MKTFITIVISLILWIGFTQTTKADIVWVTNDTIDVWSVPSGSTFNVCYHGHGIYLQAGSVDDAPWYDWDFPSGSQSTYIVYYDPAVEGEYFYYMHCNRGSTPTYFYLNFIMPVTSSQNISICQGDSYTIGSHTYTTAGTYVDTIPAVNTCDSIVTTHLTVNQPTTSTQNISACETYTWFGTTYTASGTHTHVIPNAHGCDSTITLNLTIANQFTMDIIPDTVIVIQGHTDTVYVTVDDEVTLLWSTGSDSLSTIVSTTGWCYVTATHSVCGSQVDSVYVDVITNVPENTDSTQISVKVCPNPASDFIEISGYHLQIESIEIFNQIGQVVLQSVDKNSLMNINISMLPKGIYYLKLDIRNGNAKPIMFLKE